MSIYLRKLNGNHVVFLDYDKENEQFLIQWNGTNKNKKVARFNLRFNIEDLNKFNARLERAKQRAKEFEMRMRFDNRVHQMPLDEPPNLANECVDEIWAKLDYNEGLSEDLKIYLKKPSFSLKL